MSQIKYYYKMKKIFTLYKKIWFIVSTLGGVNVKKNRLARFKLVMLEFKNEVQYANASTE